MNNFAISAMGRSGTKFLATMMNRSEVWDVVHEPSTRFGSTFLATDPALVMRRFVGRTFYGEVNSLLRHVLTRLPVSKRGVILRHPHNILISAANRRPLDKDFLNLIALGFVALDDAITQGASPIYFEWMTTSVEYMRQVLQTFGIDDVRPKIADLAKKVNATPDAEKKSTIYIRDIPVSTRKYYDAQTGWFTRKYYGDQAEA